MNKILTITGLTWKSAFRYRLFWVMVVMLFAAVVGLPLMLKDDGTAKRPDSNTIDIHVDGGEHAARVSPLCGFRAAYPCQGIVEECQMQVVSVKPIARWQIWIRKMARTSVDERGLLLALAVAGIFMPAPVAREPPSGRSTSHSAQRRKFSWRGPRLPRRQRTAAGPETDGRRPENRARQGLPYIYTDISTRRNQTADHSRAAHEAEYTEAAPGRLHETDVGH